MNLKAAVKYQIHDSKKSLLIFYSIIYAILIFMIFLSNISVKGEFDFSFSGIETSSMIFIFVFGLNSFKETFKMFLQNGLSRKTLFTGFIVSITAVSAFMALVDSINAMLTNTISTYESAYMQIYGQRYVGSLNDFQKFLEGFLWYIFSYAFIAMVGFFITTLFYRLNKGMKLVVSIGVPALFMVIIPIIDSSITDGAIYRTIGNFFSFAWGYKNGFNPYFSMITCTLLFALFGGLSYLLVSKATAKE